MNCFIATDHAGYDVKDFVKDLLIKKGFEVIDLGCNSTDRVDYPDFAHKLCKEVLANSGSFGVLICGTGIGMSITANRHKGIRAALCHDEYTAFITKAHNDANVLCFGSRVVGLGVIESIIDGWCRGVFEGGRHSDRVKKIELES